MHYAAPTNTNAIDDSLIYVGEDFSPPPWPTPTEFTDDWNRDEMFFESGRSCLFEITAEAGSAAGAPRDKADASQTTLGLCLYDLKNIRKALIWLDEKF